MTSNYDAIRRNNLNRFGTDIGRIGKMLLADRYDDRTHFIYELLQNAEDALSKRPNRTGKRSVRFNLKGDSLSVRHFGKPFDKNDVEGVCGIDESTKDITSIGRFGIGFKSVYAFTQLPEIHSGDEDFAIENYVWPRSVPYYDREHDETVIVMPGLNSNDCEEIEDGLARMGPDALIFLKEIEEIEWATRNGSSGVYLRQSENLDDNVYRITIVGNADGLPDTEQVWLVFSKNIYAPDGVSAGRAEIAFLIEDDEVRAIPSSPLVVFFPTVVKTDLGFLIQGPYRTTPSRDNVHSKDEWNLRCIHETAGLLPGVLAWLRDHDMLTVNTLQLLPFDLEKFPTNSMFHSFFRETKRCLSEDSLLPDSRGGYVSGNKAVLSGTRAVRELFTAAQLAELAGGDPDIMWLDGGISQDRTPALRKYLREILGVKEYEPRTIPSLLNTSFLQRQSDEWLRRLYEFLADQPSLRRWAMDFPLIRLDDGTHTKPCRGGKAAVFLPGEAETGFPTIRRSACESDKARDFLRTLGLTEPNAVDDIIANVLPKYADADFNISEGEYKKDMRRIMEAFETDSRTQRDKITERLRGSWFVRCMDAEDSTVSYAQPENVYYPTERLKQLFSGVRGIKLSDDGDEIFRTYAWRSLLEACGVVRYLRPVRVDDVSRLSSDRRKELRNSINWGDKNYRSERIEDWDLFGVNDLIELLPNLDLDDRTSRCRFLWEELANLRDRRGEHVYRCAYSWSFYGAWWSAPQDSSFVRLLNSVRWIPDSSGNLQDPGALDFESLGWKADPFLQSKIKFRPPVVEQLAREVGLDPELLRRLKEEGITSVADFEKLSPSKRSPTRGALEVAEHERESAGAGLDGRDDGVDRNSGTYDLCSEEKTRDYRGYNRDSYRSASHRFVSYIAVRYEESSDDPDRLKHEDRMDLESQAIEFILSREPQWTTAPASNPGFDLFEEGSDGQPARWCEVKAMTGTLDDRPVTLSRTQFECARQKGQDYYLYVVELAGTPGSRRLVRIQNPAGEARYFTFDRGWRDIADSDHE